VASESWLLPDGGRPFLSSQPQAMHDRTEIRRATACLRIDHVPAHGFEVFLGDSLSERDWGEVDL
jgi:hypothetical protein